ncbi:MAG: hypothetical protein OXT67_07820, partial [Zetaproteobacteria bacterium]|nr:hypothetical protein [Zetaproteobacteria bacterium]
MKNTSNHIILLLALGLSPASAAQEALSPEAVSGTNDPVKSQSTQISWTYTRHARSILKKFMRETPFDVYATAELMQQIADIPYAPDNIQAYVRQEYSLAELSKYVKQISVEVKVPEWIDSDTRNSLQEVLQRRLFLNTTRGDQVSFTNMKLKVIAPTLESTTQENTLQGETRKELLETQAKLQKLEEEFKAKDASYQDKIKDLQSQLEQSNSSPSQPSSESQDVAIKGFFADMQDHLPLVGGILLFLFITLVVTTVLPSKLFVTAINHFPKAYQGIAGAIKSLGEALQNMAPSGGGELTHP